MADVLVVAGAREASAVVAVVADTDQAWAVAAVDIGQAWAAAPADLRFRPARGLRRSAVRRSAGVTGRAARALIQASLQEETDRTSVPARGIDLDPDLEREWAEEITPAEIGRVAPGPVSAATGRASERAATVLVLVRALWARAEGISRA